MSKLEYSRGDVLASKYEVIDHVDENPLGVSYRVKHLKSGKFVRLVLLRPQIANRETKDTLVDAFRRAKDLKNPHLVRLGELGEHQGTAFYTMEDFDGTTLRELLQQYKINSRKFGLKDGAQVVNQVLEALNFLHDEGVVFRALRPEHILVNVRYAGPRQQNFVAHVKLVGACLWDLVPAGTLTEDEFTRGEAQYLAPEFKSFEPKATARSDIYSAGVVFYEMLTGSAPVGTFLPPTQLRPEFPKLVDDVVELAMAHAPEDRYRSARDLINGIQRVFEAATEGVTEETNPWPMIAAIAGIGIVLVIAVTVIVWVVLTKDTDKTAQVEDQNIRLTIKSEHSEPTDAERQAMQGNHPPNMAYVPPGPYISGRMNHDPYANRNGEALHQRIELPGYMIDMFEYPNELNGRPRAVSTWEEAKGMCEAAGKRLCSSQEWEKACKGPLNYIYSYGDTWDETFCGGGISTDYRSGMNKECRSGWGVFDMSGGLKEWAANAPVNDPTRRVVKGGTLSSPEKGTRCAYSTDESVSYSHATLSFRCCRAVDAPPIKAIVDEPDTDAGDTDNGSQ